MQLNNMARFNSILSLQSINKFVLLASCRHCNDSSKRTRSNMQVTYVSVWTGCCCCIVA